MNINNLATKNISVIGSTGSIGTQSLNVAQHKNYNVVSLSAGKNYKLLEEQARRFKPDFCAMADEESAKKLKIALADTDIKVFSGNDGICEMIRLAKADYTINSIVGKSGLRPTLAAVDSSKRLALANKESLVTAGEIVMSKVKENNVELLPVDSEHSAIFQCLMNGASHEVKKLILTASGGPFFGKQRFELNNITPKDALAHPNWNMGAKITIDSATLMNKGFELIEACHLFSLPPEKIEVIVNRESIIHSMVEYIDNNIIALLSAPDMRMCIQYALTYPEREEGDFKNLNLWDVGTLTFAKPDTDTFSPLALAKEVMKTGGVMPCVLNAANEVAVESFLNEKISFVKIFDLLENIVSTYKNIKNPTIDDIEAADIEARNIILSKI